jgi:hypothetical protein
MVAQLFWVFAMVLRLEVAFAVFTREVVSFAISETFSAAYAVLQKLAISGSHAGWLLEVDRSSRRDVWVAPDTGLTKIGGRHPT